MVRVIITIKNGMVEEVHSTEDIEYYVKDRDVDDPREWLISYTPDVVSQDIVENLKREVKEVGNV